MQSYIADPLSTQEIRQMAINLRRNFGLNSEEDKMFPIVEFIELVVPSILEEFTLEILPQEEMGNVHGLACPEENCIKVREDVYERAIDGYGRDRFTLAHELGHFLLHHREHIRLARLENGSKIEAFRDPEWQANTFAAELLMPLGLIDTEEQRAIADEFGVSLQAASIRAKKIYKH